eukprot:10807835-Alexandrium_andersonii.AAC.1
MVLPREVHQGVHDRGRLMPGRPGEGVERTADELDHLDDALRDLLVHGPGDEVEGVRGVVRIIADEGVLAQVVNVALEEPSFGKAVGHGRELLGGVQVVGVPLGSVLLVGRAILRDPALEVRG